MDINEVKTDKESQGKETDDEKEMEICRES